MITIVRNKIFFADILVPVLDASKNENEPWRIKVINIANVPNIMPIATMYIKIITRRFVVIVLPLKRDHRIRISTLEYVSTHLTGVSFETDGWLEMLFSKCDNDSWS